ncbi:hypothetical protein [Rhizobium leguminosarum]|uniref:hypothetical protein n=1 Tax=Rhizobium leguminosarum TaxID=384 RepID=UPI0021BC215C|nr:hypothetical protein [Rhizobium leguminosarum]
MTEIVQWLADSRWLPVADSLVTIFGFPFALLGLYAVRRQMKNDGLAVSAGAIGEMRTSIMSRVDRLIDANQRKDTAQWEYEFAEFANDLEMACAIYLDGQMKGRTGDLARKMIIDLLKIVDQDEEMSNRLKELRHANDTFKNIQEFKATVKR